MHTNDKLFNDPPWAGVGTKVDPDMTTQEMLETSGLDWSVDEHPTFAEVPQEDGTNYRVQTNQKALIRSSDKALLSVVGDNWHPLQNEDAFDYFRQFIEAGKMQMHTVGDLGSGKIVWALAKVDDGFEVFGGDRIGSYFLFSNPHHYGKRVEIRMMPIREVSQTTLTLATERVNDKAVRVDHRKAFQPGKVRNAVVQAQRSMDAYRETALRLGSLRAKPDMVREYFGELIGWSNTESDALSRTAQKMMDSIQYQPGAEYAAGSWWQVYNALTYNIDHVLGWETDSRLEAAWFGRNEKLKVKGLTLAAQYAAKSPSLKARLVAA